MWNVYCDYNPLTSVFSIRLRTNHYAFSTSNDLEMLMQGLKKIVKKYETEEYYIDMLKNSGLIKVFDYDTKEEDYNTNKYCWKERQELVDLTVKEALEEKEQERREKKRLVISKLAKNKSFRSSMALVHKEEPPKKEKTKKTNIKRIRRVKL